METAPIKAVVNCETQETTFEPLAGEELAAYRATVAQASAARSADEERASAVREARRLFRAMQEGKRTPTMHELGSAITTLVDAVLGPMASEP